MSGIILLFLIAIFIQLLRPKKKRKYNKSKPYQKKPKQTKKPVKNRDFYRYKKQTYNKEKIVYLKTKELAEYFNITNKQMQKVFQLLKWIVPSEKKGWKATDEGKKRNVKEGIYMGINYIHWDIKIKNNFRINKCYRKSKN